MMRNEAKTDLKSIKMDGHQVLGYFRQDLLNIEQNTVRITRGCL